MTRRVKGALQVKGSRDFQEALRALDKVSDEYRDIDEALSFLKANILAGVRVSKRLWPKTYVEKYGINNLYKLDMRAGRRLTYTIAGEEGGYSVIVLEYFRSHKEYELRFGY